MALEEVGIKLVAEGSDKYLQTLTQATTAETKLASAAAPAVAGINKLDDSATGAGKALDQMGDDAKQGGKGLSFLEQAAVGAARKVGELVVNAAGEAGRAIVAFVGDSIGKAGDFEAGMNRFASVAGSAIDASGKSVGEFKELFMSLGRDLPVSTQEVQDAAIEMAKGGIEPATIAAGGLRTVLDLAAAGEVGIAEAAEISAKQLGIWVDSAASADEKARFLTDAANLLAKAANTSTVDVSGLALGMANVGGIAHTAGLSFADTIQAMALLAPGFSSAADAGTSFKTFLTRLQPVTEPAAEAMAKLGLLTAEGTSKFYDAEGSFIGMEGAAGLLQKSLEGMSEAEKTATLSAVFGNDAFRAAALLAEKGADGFHDMGVSMDGAGSAAEQAAKKQEGFNFAMENLGGSVEVLQLILGGAILPVLTTFLKKLAGGVNVLAEYAKATFEGKTALSTVAGIIQTTFIPALTGVTAALITYATVQTIQAIPAIYASIPAIAAQAAAFYANAAAIAAALAPYALIAGAIGGVVLAYQNFTSKVSDATTQLLDSRQWWTDSAKAIENYGTQTGDAQKKLEPYAATINVLREQIRGEVEDLGKRMAAGLLSDEQYATEMKTINEHREGLIRVTDAYNIEQEAINKQTAAALTATSAADGLKVKTSEVGLQAGLTAKDIEDLGKKIQDTYAKGQDALQKYAGSFSTFSSGLELRADENAKKIADLEAQKQKATTKEQKAGIDDQIAQVKQGYADQEEAAAQSYAAQQAAQKQALGQQLIDYTVAQAQLGNISKEKAAEITAGLEKEYGLQESSTATTFLHMAQSIDEFATDSGASIDGLIGDLRDQGQAAQDTQRAMDDYAKEYVATQTNNFVEGKQDADEYIQSLESIPKEINTTVTTTYRDKQDNRGDDPSQQAPGRAVGGPVEAGRSYLVGEQGPEIITPPADGYVITASETKRAMASMAQLGAMGGGGSVVTTTIINVDARGSSLTMADITRGVQVGLETAGRSADVQVRAGG